MTNRKHSSALNHTNMNAETKQAESSSHYGADLARRGSRREPWAYGFLTPYGTQIPLFVRQSRRLAK